MPQRQHPRVVIATRIFTPEVAAAAFRLDALARALGDEGARVLVLTSRPPGADRRSDTPGVRVSRARTLRGVDGYIRGYAQYLSFDVPLFLRLLALHPRPDVLVAEPPPTTGAVVRVAAAIRRIPYVHYAADVWSDAAGSMDVPGFVVAALRGVERFALRRASRVIAVNEGVAGRVRRLGARRVDVVPNGIDTSVFAPVERALPGARAEVADAADLAGSVGHQGAGASGRAAARGADSFRREDMPERFLIYAGTASEWQGAGIFVDAFEQIRDEFPDLDLVYMGQGSDLAAIQRKVGGDPRVHFVGQMPPADAARWQASAEAALVSIVPGRGYDFASPTKVLAALACGTPVVYAGVGPVVDDLRGADLGEVADYDVRAVADAIRDVLERPRDPQRLRAWVQEHRSLEATGRGAADAVLGALTPRRARSRRWWSRSCG